LKGLAQSQQEFKEEQKALQAAQVETDRILKELSAEIKENSREIKEVHKELSAEIKENSREIKEVHKELSAEIKAVQTETAREIKAAQKEVNTSIGRLSNRLGEFVEEAVRPSAVRLFRERGIDIHEVQQSITAKRDGEQLEIDLLVVNNENVVVIECKSNLGVDDVNDHLERLEKVKRLLPRYNNCKVLGAVAGMVIPDNVATYAIKKGLYVIGQNGDHLELRNETSFTAKAW
jgi:hypothetical protein